METDGLLAVELLPEQKNWHLNEPHNISIKFTNRSKQPNSWNISLSLSIDGPKERNDKYQLICPLPISADLSGNEFFQIDLSSNEITEFKVDLSSVLCSDFHSKKGIMTSVKFLKDILVAGNYGVYLDTYRHGRRSLRSKTADIVVVKN